MRNLEWQSNAACIDELSPDHWFSDDAEERQAALGVCMECPVLALCREWAIEEFPTTPDWYVVGGMTRVSLGKARKAREVKAPPHLRLP